MLSSGSTKAVISISIFAIFMIVCLAVSITVIIILVKAKVKVQAELANRMLTSQTCKEVPPVAIDTIENVAYGMHA